MKSKLRKNPMRSRMTHARRLLIDDDELIKLLDLPPKKARAIVQYLDLNSKTTGFPQKQKIWHNKRYRPDVERWLKRPTALMFETVPALQ